ncbi:MAG: DNA replication and repair protein RecF, partial [Wolbachia sp.]
RKALMEEVLSIQCQTWITDVNQDNFNSYLYSFKFFELSNE